ncbi:hypothetical protein Patl1_27783 [Pistacia atlantica]|uniref:Uncharacterized protein n=1 Tax=Pistacia atlantica TaxID=434234 RepID=A0ACC1BH38_9ROSI|nr:hypothetical protein Patl1_27783 [Pistacia atlantica]
MLDNGNFVVYNESSDIIWSSFDYPTDTMLGGQNLYAGRELFSNVSKTNSSTGRFHLKMQEDGNLVFVYKTSILWASAVPDVHICPKGFCGFNSYCTVHDNQSIAVVFLKKIAENPVWKTAIVMPCSIRQGFCSKLKYPLKAFWRDSESSFTSYFKAGFKNITIKGDVVDLFKSKTGMILIILITSGFITCSCVFLAISGFFNF